MTKVVEELSKLTDAQITGARENASVPLSMAESVIYDDNDDLLTLKLFAAVSPLASSHHYAIVLNKRLNIFYSILV
jgi:methionine synthase I (cobalamin-dependent)